jgi:hypothetical protein
MTRTSLTSCCVAAILFTFAPAIARPAGATDKYVDCTNGLDSNSGSISSKWKTIQQAANAVGSGDFVHVSGGPCSESNVTFPASASGLGSNCRSSDSGTFSETCPFRLATKVIRTEIGRSRWTRYSPP